MITAFTCQCKERYKENENIDRSAGQWANAKDYKSFERKN